MRPIFAPLAIGLIGIAILLWLGTWQIQRLAWKEGILAEIDATIIAEQRPLPRLIDPSAQRYMPIEMTGQIEEDPLRVLVSAKQRGAGYRLISALQTQDGRRVLLDRGFLPVADPLPDPQGQTVTVEGNLHWPDDRNSSTPENDWDGNILFARDIAEMAEVLQTEPLLVIARRITPPEPGMTPMPVDSSGIPNDHLQYAITWFSLAAVWALMTGLWIRRRLKES